MAPASPATGLVVVAQARSSGASTATITMAAVWPRPVLVAELDPAGGDIATRFGLSANVGVLGLAATGASRLDTLADHVQVADGLSVLVGPPGPEQAEAALAGLWKGLPSALAALPGGDVVADCGRLGPASPVVDHVVPQATVVALVARADQEGFVRLHHRLVCSPPGLAAKAVVILVGDGRAGCRAADFQRALGVEVIGTLADDWRGAAMVAAGRISGRALRSSALARSARPIVQSIAARLRAPALPSRHASTGNGIAPSPQVLR